LRRKERKQFFFEKKNQKTFDLLVGRDAPPARAIESNSFLVLFFKKELLPLRSHRQDAVLDLTLSAIVDVGAFAARWRALQAEACPGPFLTWHFVGCDLALRYAAPHALAVRENGRDVALGLLNRAGGKWYLQTTGDRRLDAIFPEHNALLARPGANGAVLAALRFLARHGPVVVSGVDDEFFAAARRTGIVTHHHPRFAPAIDLGGIRGDYLDGRSANTRAQIRRAMRLAGRGLAIHRAATPAIALDWFADMVALHTASWQARGGTGAFADAAVRGFYEALIRGDDGACIADLLRVTAGGETLGIMYNLRHGGHVCCYQSGFRPARDARDKPGLVCHALAIDLYRSEGEIRYDLLAGAERYKVSLASGGQTLHWFTLHPPDAVGARVRRLAEQVTARVRRGRLR
jgi:CelD/BcsL family acetyltransferase involved in cellulose biosynthesis